MANASHELRTPLTAIRTEADVALANPRRRDRRAARDGGGVLEAADRMDELLDGLMELARGQRRVVGRERVDLAAAARAASGDVAPSGVALRWHSRPRACAETPGCSSAWPAT